MEREVGLDESGHIGVVVGRPHGRELGAQAPQMLLRPPSGGVLGDGHLNGLPGLQQVTACRPAVDSGLAASP